VAPALAAGCTVVLKPSPETPLTALRLAALAMEAGLPAGVLNVVCGGGATGAALCAHPGIDKISFTGSTPTGRAIGHAAVDRMARFTLELGGKSPMIVLPDADPAAAAMGAAMGIFFNQGQVCSASSLLYVPQPVRPGRTRGRAPSRKHAHRLGLRPRIGARPGGLAPALRACDGFPRRRSQRGRHRVDRRQACP
jgi:acyl-CoA reductase-like NAD-dependent aldehyde dehydrogenase